MTITVTIGGKKLKSREEKAWEEKKTPEVILMNRKELEDFVTGENTLRRAFDRFIENKKGDLAESTLKKYAQVRDLHFQDIMDLNMSEMTEELYQAALQNEASRGWTEKTMKGYCSILKNVMTIEASRGWTEKTMKGYCSMLKNVMTIEAKK